MRLRNPYGALLKARGFFVVAGDVIEIFGYCICAEESNYGPERYGRELH